MSNLFNDNFRKMFTIIAKSASAEKDCPIPYTMVKMYIDNVFTEEYDATNRRIFRKYSEKVEDSLKQRGSSIDKAIKEKDRSVFECASIIPEDMIPEYKNYTAWFTEFLRNRMSDDHISLVFRYIRTLKNQV